MNAARGHYKRKRGVVSTLLLVSEGETEAAFLKFLKGTFVSRGSGIAVTVRNARGGSPESVIAFAKKQLNGRAFNRCLIVMDTDRPWPQPPPARIQRVPIEYVKVEPCIEGLLLQIIDPDDYQRSWDTEACKREFENRYLDSKRKLDHRNFDRILSRDFLLSRQCHVPALDAIVRALAAQT